MSTVTLKEAFEILSQKKACTSIDLLQDVVAECLQKIKDSALNRRYGFLIYRYFNYVFGTGEDLDGLLDTILLRQYESSNLMLYVEIFNLLAFAFDRKLVHQPSIFLMAQILNSLENKSRVWTLYEVFNQEDDPTIEPAKREHLYIRCKDMLQKILQNLLNQNEDFADSLTVRFLKYRLDKCQDDTEALDLAKECIRDPTHFWMAKNLLLDCKTHRQTMLETLNQSSETSMVQYRYDPGTYNELDKLWSKFVLNVLEKSIERKERPDMAILWQDTLQTEVKSLFDEKDCPIVDFVQTYDEAKRMTETLKTPSCDVEKMRLIDCLTYYQVRVTVLRV